MKVLKPIFGSDRVFKRVRRRTDIGESLSSKSGRAYALMYDATASYEAFKLLVEQLPDYEGVIILSAGQDNRIIKIIKAPISIQATFSQPSIRSRFLEIISIMNRLNINTLQVQLAKAS